MIYFSGTGNTQLITNELKKELENTGNEVFVYTVEQLSSETTIDIKDATVGLGFPVYKFTYPRIMERIMPLLGKSTSTAKVTPFFVYSTYCRFAANSLHHMAKEVEKLGLKLITSKSFKCPSNGIASLKEKVSFEYQTVMYFENNIDSSIRNFANTIVKNTDDYYKTGKCIKHYGGFADSLKISIVGNIEKSRYPELTIDKSTCNLCRLCVKRCPENNLIFDKGKVIILDIENCMHCLRCMHHCPTHSITFGELVYGPNRYTKKMRNLLFGQAVDMIGDIPERGTKKIKRQWALKNLKYWLFHK